MFFEEIIVAHLHHLFRIVQRSELVFLHYYQIAVGYLLQHLVVREIKRLLECRNLSQ